MLSRFGSSKSMPFIRSMAAPSEAVSSCKKESKKEKNALLWPEGKKGKNGLSDGERDGEIRSGKGLNDDRDADDVFAEGGVAGSVCRWQRYSKEARVNSFFFFFCYKHTRGGGALRKVLVGRESGADVIDVAGAGVEEADAEGPGEESESAVAIENVGAPGAHKITEALAEGVCAVEEEEEGKGVEQGCGVMRSFEETEEVSKGFSRFSLLLGEEPDGGLTSLRRMVEFQ